MRANCFLKAKKPCSCHAVCGKCLIFNFDFFVCVNLLWKKEKNIFGTKKFNTSCAREAGCISVNILITAYSSGQTSKDTLITAFSSRQTSEAIKYSGGEANAGEV